MRVRIVYDCDGVNELVLEGPRVTAHPERGRGVRFRVRDAAGVVVRSVGLTVVYSYDLDRTAAVDP